jgi:hypothetical protein
MAMMMYGRGFGMSAWGEISLDRFETAKRALGYPSSPEPPPPGPF